MSDHTPLRTVAEAAARLNCSASTVRALVKAGRLGHVRVGQGLAKPRVRFTEADLDAYIDGNRRAAIAAPAPPAATGPPARERRSLKDLPEAARYA